MVAYRFWVLRSEWCQKWCQHPHRVVLTRRALRGHGAQDILPNISFHDLSYACATFLILNGVNPMSVQWLLEQATAIRLAPNSQIMPSMGEGGTAASE